MRSIKYVLAFLLMGMFGNLSAQITFFQGTFEAVSYTHLCSRVHVVVRGGIRIIYWDRAREGRESGCPIRSSRFKECDLVIGWRRANGFVR